MAQVVVFIDELFIGVRDALSLPSLAMSSVSSQGLEAHSVVPSASYLSPESESSLKAPTIPTKPLRATLTLVVKAYSAAGQAVYNVHLAGIPG